MDFLDRNIDFKALLKFSNISPSTRQHLKQVYASFALSLLVAAAGAYVNVVFRFLQGSFMSFAGSLGMMLWLMMTPHSRETEKKRLGILAGFAFFSGIGLGPALNLCLAVDPSIIPTAFLATAVIFTCFSLSALYAQRRTYLYLGGVLMSVMSLLLLSGLVNIFIGSTILLKFHLYVGLLVMCGFVLFDTQLIIEKVEHGDKDYVWHCVDLFLDFIAIFRKIMVILAMNEKEKKKERK
ncbi:bax inhibitor 1 [Rana temporaria]|uniref:bax inhibitor 1 n=1 Tax=Rana temporaria TaxID=8407 RepID=UPI001AAD5DE4|nr:bax inhibitor 1 [Rana temporaria]